MFYEQVVNLCKAKNISISKLIKDIGLSKSNATYWKNGSIPKSNTLKKVADYFNVSADSLLAKEIVINEDNKIDEQTRKIINDPDIHQYILVSIKAKEKGLSPETLEKLIELYTK